MKKKRILLAGESWMKHTIHVKGFDSLTTDEYEEGPDGFSSGPSARDAVTTIDIGA